MSLGNNIQYLRKVNRLTQEQFAERMNITRQTVSRWESDEVTPELSKLVELCSMFSCKLDELVREDMTATASIYSDVTIRKVPAFKMARYAVISPNPEDDVQKHMKEWGQESGLLAVSPDAKLIGWDFPFVSQEQQTRFGMHGYAAAYIIPDDFKVTGVAELAENLEAEYAVITVTEPMVQPFERIPAGYKHIMAFLEKNSFKDKQNENILACFEYEYEKDGVNYMDIFVHAAGVVKTDGYSVFN